MAVVVICESCAALGRGGGPSKKGGFVEKLGTRGPTVDVEKVDRQELDVWSAASGKDFDILARRTSTEIWPAWGQRRVTLGALLSISAESRTPTDEGGWRYGHMLALGHQRRTFIRPNAANWEHAHSSSDGASTGADIPSSTRPGPAGPSRNMGSSQVACLNILVPVCEDMALLLALLRAIDPDGDWSGHDPGSRCRNLVPVEFEWNGVGHAPREKGSRGAGSWAPAATRC